MLELAIQICTNKYNESISCTLGIGFVKEIMTNKQTKDARHVTNQQKHSYGNNRDQQLLYEKQIA